MRLIHLVIAVLASLAGACPPPLNGIRFVGKNSTLELQEYIAELDSNATNSILPGRTV
jgi:hypothetical protein